jgi:hypothetical protein
MTEMVRAPAAETAQGPRVSVQQDSSNGPEHYATTGHAQAEPENQANGFYVPKDIKSKRHRRTKAAISSVRDAIKDILGQSNPQTVRQVFYALTVRSVIAKAEIEYKKTVIRLLVEMRERGEVPFEWLADNTRWMRKPSTFTGIESCLSNTSKFYRRDLWAAMPAYVEVWCEKDALAGVIMEETEKFDVPLMVAKGYASLSFLHSAAQTIKATGKPAYMATSILPASMLPATSKPSFAATHPVPRSTLSGPRSHANKSSSGICRHVRRNRPTAGRRSSAATPRSSWTRSPLTNSANSCASASNGTSIRSS